MPSLTNVADGVWCATAPVRFLGLRLTANMTVLRLAGDALLVHSPVALSPELQAEVDALGRVAHLYSPNTFHHLRLGDWAAVYPRAKVHAPPGLVKKRPDVRITRLHGSQPEPDFHGLVDERRIEGFLLEEAVLFHRPSGTLVVADLVHNVGRPSHWWTRLYTTAAGFYGTVNVSRVIRLTAFTDRHAARRCVDDVLALPLTRVVVGHGEPLLDDARAQLARAYEFLPRRPALPAGSTRPSGCA